MERLVDWLCQRSAPIGSPDLLDRWYCIYWSDLAHQTAEDGNSFLHEIQGSPNTF